MARKLTKEEAVEIAVRDAVKRVGGEPAGARSESSDATFPNSALDAARPGEWSADMQTNGWTIRVATGGRSLEYRATSRQVRLVDFDGDNHVVFPD